MKFAYVLLGLVFSLSGAARCDKYVITGGDSLSGIGGNMYQKQISKIEGCKKGCFDNNTFTDYGGKKCEKCSLIEDKEFCEQFETCQWTKSGKCKSASCPQRAKKLNENTEERIAEFGKCMKDSESFKQHCDNTCTTNYDAQLTWCLSAYYNNNTYCTKRKQNCLDSCRRYWEEGQYYNPPNPIGCHTGPTYDPEFPPSGPNEDAFNCGECVNNLCGGKAQCFSMYGYAPPTIIANRFAHNYARKVCHNIHGCLYSKSKNRCAATAVWAFVLALILSILFVVVVAGVVGFFLFLKKNKNKVAA